MRIASIRASAVAASVLLLAACVSVPAGPSLQALPGSRKSFEQFTLDDTQCRSQATAQLGGYSPTDAANQSATASAVAGTAIGAVTGAMIDGSSGAAVGAGIGLLYGAMAGTATSQDTYAIAQQQFDGTYYLCMYARGHKVPVPASDVARYRARYDRMTPRPGPAPGQYPGAAIPPPPDLAPPESRPPTR
jgi:hypothetical protein